MFGNALNAMAFSLPFLSLAGGTLLLAQAEVSLRNSLSLSQTLVIKLAKVRRTTFCFSLSP